MSSATRSPTSTGPPDERALLIATWEAWDRRPGSEHAANAFVDACQMFAGAAALDLRRHLGACRRAGMTRTAAVAAWEAEW